MKSIDNNYNMITIWKLNISLCYGHTDINYEQEHRPTNIYIAYIAITKSVRVEFMSQSIARVKYVK